jgi:hypothetical protein
LPSGKAAVCKTAMTAFDSRDRVSPPQSWGVEHKSKCWSSSEVGRHVEAVRRRRPETVLQHHSRLAQRQEQLVYTQKNAGSSPCIGNHTLLAEQVGSRLLPGTIEVRVLERVPSGDSPAWPKARGLDPRERRFKSSSPDHIGVAQLAEHASPKRGDGGSTPSADANSNSLVHGGSPPGWS